MQNNVCIFVNIFFETTEIYLKQQLRLVMTDHFPFPKIAYYVLKESPH